MRNKIILLQVFFSICLLSNGQFMMMKTESNNQQFRAESTRSGHTDKTDVLSYTMDLKSTRDAASGQATGKRQYQPILLWKNSGASSPQFFQALVTNESIKKITLEFYRPDEVFKQNELAYTIELENASITGYRQVMGVPDQAEFRAKGAGLYDEIRIVFEKITVTDKKARTQYNDAWRMSL